MYEFKQQASNKPPSAVYRENLASMVQQKYKPEDIRQIEKIITEICAEKGFDRAEVELLRNRTMVSRYGFSRFYNALPYLSSGTIKAMLSDDETFTKHMTAYSHLHSLTRFQEGAKNSSFEKELIKASQQECFKVLVPACGLGVEACYFFHGMQKGIFSKHMEVYLIDINEVEISKAKELYYHYCKAEGLIGKDDDGQSIFKNIHFDVMDLNDIFKESSAVKNMKFGAVVVRNPNLKTEHCNYETFKNFIKNLPKMMLPRFLIYAACYESDEAQEYFRLMGIAHLCPKFPPQDLVPQTDTLRFAFHTGSVPKDEKKAELERVSPKKDEKKMESPVSISRFKASSSKLERSASFSHSPALFLAKPRGLVRSPSVDQLPQRVARSPDQFQDRNILSVSFAKD